MGAVSAYQPFPMAGRAGAQVWRYAPEYRRPRHFHEEPELNLVAAGTAVFAVGGERIVAERGALLWWLPGVDHELLEASQDLDLFVVGLTPALSERVLGGGARSAYWGPRVARLGAGETKACVDRCVGLLGIADAPSAETRIGDLWRDAHASRLRSVMHPLTKRALRLLFEGCDVRRDDVTSRLHSPEALSRNFRTNVGVTFSAYRARWRVLRFIHGVDQGDTLLGAALSAGFGSYSQCHRSFRQILGCTPRDFFSHGLRRAMIDAYEPQRSI